MDSGPFSSKSSEQLNVATLPSWLPSLVSMKPFSISSNGNPVQVGPSVADSRGQSHHNNGRAQRDALVMGFSMSQGTAVNARDIYFLTLFK